MLNLDFLLLLVDSKGGETDNASTITETYLADWSRVKDGYNLPYPTYGCRYLGTEFGTEGELTDSNLYCVNIQYSRENKKFYSADPNYSQFNGCDCITVEATYSINYNSHSDLFTKKVAGSGYKTFKIRGGGAKWRYTMEDTTIPTTDRRSLPVANNQHEYDYKVPLSQIDLKTTIIGEVDESAYIALQGKINEANWSDDDPPVDLGFLGHPRGTVLFDSYSIVPNFISIDNEDLTKSVVSETELTLTFKVLPFDWNWEFRSKVQFTNDFDKKPAFWQSVDKMSDRFDYIYDYNELNTKREDAGLEPLTPYECYLYDCVKGYTIESEQLVPIYMTYAEIKEQLEGMPIWDGSILRTKVVNNSTTPTPENNNNQSSQSVQEGQDGEGDEPEPTPTPEPTTEPQYSYDRYGDIALGQEGWDARYWLIHPELGDYAENRLYIYQYADFSTLLTGHPVIPSDDVPPPTPQPTSEPEEEQEGEGE